MRRAALRRAILAGAVAGAAAGCAAVAPTPGAPSADAPTPSVPRQLQPGQIIVALAAPLAGKQRGAFFMPERGDEVLVAFEDGSFNSPYIIGFLWNGVDMPPETDSQNRVIMTPGGHTLRFEDGNEKKIVLKSSSGQTITLDDTENSITLEGGGRILKMSNGVVRIS